MNNYKKDYPIDTINNNLSVRVTKLIRNLRVLGVVITLMSICILLVVT